MRTSRPIAPGFKPQRTGLGQVLGELEAEIMETIWSLGATTVREVHGVLIKERELAYTTVMTVMTRLSEKGLLEREAEGNSYIYLPSLTREAFISSAVGEVLDALMGSHSVQTVSHFAARLDKVNEEELRFLEEMIRLRKEGR